MSVVLPSSIAAYEADCLAILSWMEGGEIDDREFDKRAFARCMEPEYHGVGMFTDESILLPSTCGHPRSDDYIALVQEMVKAGIVTRRDDGRRVFYSKAT